MSNKITLSEAIKGLEELQKKVTAVKDPENLKVSNFHYLTTLLQEIESRVNTIDNNIDETEVDIPLSTIRSDIESIYRIIRKPVKPVAEAHSDILLHAPNGVTGVYPNYNRL